MVESLLLFNWSSDGKKLAYVSFERGNLLIYLQDIVIGARELVFSFCGINGALLFLPDGRRLVLVLLRSGNLEIYVMDLGSK